MQAICVRLLSVMPVSLPPYLPLLPHTHSH